MRKFLLVGLFAILLSDIMLNLGLTLGPGLSLKNAGLYLLFMVLVLEFSVGRRDPLRETWTLHAQWVLLISYAVFTWLVIVLLGIHRGYDNLEGFIAMKGQLVDLFLFMLVYLYGPRDTATALSMIRWLIAVLIVVNVVTMIDVFNVPDLGIINDRRDGRLAGPMNEVNQYGAILIFIIPITVGLTLASAGFGRVYYGFGSLIAVVLLGLTVSRGSYLGLFVGGIWALYLVRDHVRREIVIKGLVVGVVILILVAAVIAYQNPEGFLKKFTVVGSSLEGVSSGRTFFWRQTLTMMSYWAWSFVTGYGWNAYATLFLGYGDPHNTYLLYWFDLGLVGLGLYVGIVAWIVRFTLRSLRSISEHIKPIVIGFIFGLLALHIALFFVGLYAPSMFIWAITGTILRLTVEQVRSSRNNDSKAEVSGNS